MGRLHVAGHLYAHCNIIKYQLKATIYGIRAIVMIPLQCAPKLSFGAFAYSIIPHERDLKAINVQNCLCKLRHLV